MTRNVGPERMRLPRSDRLSVADGRPGFTLIEVVVVVTIVGVLGAIGMPRLAEARHKAMVAAAIMEIRSIQQQITEFELTNGRFPTGLSEIGIGSELDPWGRPYAYLNHSGATPGAFRKDRFLVPVNSDYDLYSTGPDGASMPPFAAPPSWDDVVRANNGGFVGLAADF